MKNRTRVLQKQHERRALGLIPKDVFKRWRAANPAKYQAWAKRRRLSHYNLTPADYDVIYQLQEGRCAICGTFKDKDVTYPLNIDHNHVTGEVRGLLCTRCNTGLSFIENLPWLMQAQGYLDPDCEWPHESDHTDPGAEIES